MSMGLEASGLRAENPTGFILAFSDPGEFVYCLCLPGLLLFHIENTTVFIIAYFIILHT